MPRQSHNGFWVPTGTTQITPGQLTTGKIWPGGYFDSLEHWQPVHLQVFRQGKHHPKNYGFTESAFEVFQDPKPLDPKFGGLINNQKTPAFIRGGNGTDLVWLKGQWHPSIPDFWYLENQTPFSTRLMSNFASLQQRHFSKTWMKLPVFPIGTTNSNSLLISSATSIEPFPNYANRSNNVYGPYVISKKPVELYNNQTIEFWWRAKGKNGSGYTFNVYLSGVGTNNVLNPPLFQQQLLVSKGEKNQANDHQRYIQANINKASEAPILSANAEQRELNEVEFEVARRRVFFNGIYHLVIVLGSWDASKTLTVDAEAEIASIRIL